MSDTNEDLKPDGVSGVGEGSAGNEKPGNPAGAVSGSPAVSGGDKKSAVLVADEAATVLDTEADTEAEVEAAEVLENPVMEDGILGVVNPGDNDGLSFTVVRMLSGRDDGIYDEGLVAAVKARQEEAGLEPDGVISGKTWALVLPSLKMGALGHSRAMLLQALGVSNTSYDEAVAALVRDIQQEAGLPETGNVDRATWTAILERASSFETKGSTESA